MTDKEQRLRELRRQIAVTERKMELLERWGDHVRSLDSFTIEEKGKIFDELYEQAREYLGSYIEDGWEPKDGDHYLYEAVLTKMLGEKVWTLIREI